MNGLWFLPSILVVGLLAVGVLGARTEILSPGLGFYLFLVGVVLSGLSALVLAGASAFASATGRAWRGSAVRAAALPLLVTVAIVLPQLSDPAPILNDVSTDLEDPPAFAPDVAAAPAPARPDLSELQRAAYPDIQPFRMSEAPAQTLQRALRTAEGMPRWEITGQDEAQGLIYAVATSRLFRFKDDVVIRIRAHDGGSELDMRSRSRIGRGDMGANAARIRAYQDRLRAASD